MPISSVTIDNVDTTADVVTVDWTAQGLIFSGTASITGFVEVTGGGFNPTILASTPIDESQGRDTASYTTGVDVSSVSSGSYTVRVNWEDDEGNSGLPSTGVTIPEADSGGGGSGGDDEFTIGEITVNCSASAFEATPGDTVEITADLEGFAPPSTMYDVDVDLFVNGEYIETKTETISPNGADAADFEIVLPEVGDYDVSVELSNLRQV